MTVVMRPIAIEATIAAMTASIESALSGKPAIVNGMSNQVLATQAIRSSSRPLTTTPNSPRVVALTGKDRIPRTGLMKLSPAKPIRAARITTCGM